MVIAATLSRCGGANVFWLPVVPGALQGPVGEGYTAAESASLAPVLLPLDGREARRQLG